MIHKATENAPSAPNGSEVSKVNDLFSDKLSKNLVSWNDASFFAGNGKKIAEWNLKDMLKFVEEQYSLKHGVRSDFAIRPAMMAMSGLRNIIEQQAEKADVNILMKSYIEWYIKNMSKWWKGKPSSWYPQKLIHDARMKEFFKLQSANNAKKEVSTFQKRPVNPILLEEFYRGDPSEFVLAYGIVIPIAFLIKTKNFDRKDAITFVVDAVKRCISSGSATATRIIEINNFYSPFDRFEEIDPEELVIIVRSRLND
jgi:hypothetical protein